MRELSKAQEQAVLKVRDGLLQIKRGSEAQFETPEDFTTVIIDIVKEKSKLYPLVKSFIPLTAGRIIIGNDVTPAEFKREIEAATLTDFSVNVEFNFSNGFKLIKAIFIDNDMLEENEGLFLSHIIKQIAESMALALDDAILNGQGEEAYQFDGIIKNIPVENQKSVTPTGISDIVEPVQFVDSGKFNENEIVAIVNRNTYYSVLLKYLLNCSNPSCLPRFIFSYAMAENQVLYGDFSKYMLIQRGGLSFERSKQVRFPYDETGYKGRINFDGKPARPQAFTLVTLQ